MTEKKSYSGLIIFGITIGIVGFVLTVFIIAGHDMYISSENDKQQFKNNLQTTNSCVLIKQMQPDETGYWWHSFTYNAVQERLGELKC